MQLRAYRELTGKTLEDVAADTGFGINAVSRHERGVNAPTAIQIEKYRTYTSGAVGFDDWLELAQEKARRSMAPPQAEPANV